MTAFNVVRMRAKPGRTEDYLDAFKVISRDRFPGMQALTVIRTGERDFCVIGAWDDMAPLVAARPQMQATLDGSATCSRTSADRSASPTRSRARPSSKHIADAVAAG